MGIYSVLAGSCVGFFAILGLLVVFLTLVRPMKPPADPSNRIAHLILVWEALKSPHRFVGLKNARGEEQFRYLSQDLGDFVRGKR